MLLKEVGVKKAMTVVLWTRGTVCDFFFCLRAEQGRLGKHVQNSRFLHITMLMWIARAKGKRFFNVNLYSYGEGNHHSVRTNLTVLDTSQLLPFLVKIQLV